VDPCRGQQITLNLIERASMVVRLPTLGLVGSCMHSYADAPTTCQVQFRPGSLQLHTAARTVHVVMKTGWCKDKICAATG